MKRRSASLVLLVGLTAGLAVPAGAAVDDPRFITKWGTLGIGDGQFSNPYGVAVAADGTVYVTDLGNDRIQYFGPTGVFQGEWGSTGIGDGQFDFPYGVAVAADGTVYVADYNNHRIQYFGPTGVFQGEWGSTGNANGEFSFPSGVAVAADGTVYVADTDNDRIQVFGPTGVFQGKWGSNGNADGQFSVPRGVAVAADGTVYVADTGNDRIQVFSPTGVFEGKWGSFGSGDGQFNLPRGVAVAADGTVYVADQINHRIQHFSPTGEFQGTWGTIGSGDGQFDSPQGVTVAPFGTVYVADRSNDRIQKFAFPSVTRAAGVNRHATAAEISMLHHPNSAAVDTVFVATGANFPDALAGAVAAAAAGSPLLLTGSVPQVTADELDRLDPDDIVILGGEAVVDLATATTLAGWGAITRLAGANRYETAVAISKYLYPTDGSADTVVIATGTGFADALAGAPLAALGNGPVLLTQPDALPGSVAAEIARLDPDEILVLGGEAAVLAAVFTQLQGLAPTTRIFGANRYATAVEVSKAAFPEGAGVVYVAVGTNFPDALAGAAQAAASGSPILLTPSDALPQSVIDEITRLDPYAIIILGGTAVITQAVENQLKTLLGL
jgi:putative cell wall-binding protein/streptogramin lyase